MVGRLLRISCLWRSWVCVLNPRVMNSGSHSLPLPSVLGVFTAGRWQASPGWTDGTLESVPEVQLSSRPLQPCLELMCALGKWAVIMQGLSV